MGSMGGGLVLGDSDGEITARGPGPRRGLNLDADLNLPEPVLGPVLGSGWGLNRSQSPVPGSGGPQTMVNPFGPEPDLEPQ